MVMLAMRRSACLFTLPETIDPYRKRRGGHRTSGVGTTTGRGAFDKAVSSEPFAFAADAVLIYGYSMPFWYFRTIGEDADARGEDFCWRWRALMLLLIGRPKQDCP
jgi:hypothetical protein